MLLLNDKSLGYICRYKLCQFFPANKSACLYLPMFGTCQTFHCGIQCIVCLYLFLQLNKFFTVIFKFESVKKYSVL